MGSARSNGMYTFRVKVKIENGDTHLNFNWCFCIWIDVYVAEIELFFFLNSGTLDFECVLAFRFSCTWMPIIELNKRKQQEIKIEGEREYHCSFKVLKSRFWSSWPMRDDWLFRFYQIWTTSIDKIARIQPKILKSKWVEWHLPISHVMWRMKIWHQETTILMFKKSLLKQFWIWMGKRSGFICHLNWLRIEN